MLYLKGKNMISQELIKSLAIDRQEWIVENWDYNFSYYVNMSLMSKDIPWIYEVDDMTHCHFYFDQCGLCNGCELNKHDNCSKYLKKWMKKVDNYENAQEEAEYHLSFLKGDII